MHVRAIFPNLARASWIKPDILSGIFWILDTERNRFTQYQPTTGQAQHHPLSEVVSDQAPIPLTPEQLFSLPSAEQFSLEVIGHSTAKDDPWAVVRAVDNNSSKEYRVWVDLDAWMVTQMESLGPDGSLELSAQAHNIQINQGITPAELRRLPPGTQEIHIP